MTGRELAGGDVDVLIPTCGRPGALAVTLTGLLGQTAQGFRVTISDQTPGCDVASEPLVAGVLRVLRARGVEVDVPRNLPRRGMAQQRHFLLMRARAPYVLFLDDDVLLGPEALQRLLSAMSALRCGAVGMPVTGLSHVDDVRPAEHRAFEPVGGSVEPERLRKGDPGWERWRLHNAANPTHLGVALGYRDRTPGREWTAYKVAWTGGCVLFERATLLAVGGYGFWPELPPDHAGEDVVVQLRVMERAGAVGVLPADACHLELPTTVTDRRVDAYAEVLDRPGGRTAVPARRPQRVDAH